MQVDSLALHLLHILGSVEPIFQPIQCLIGASNAFNLDGAPPVHVQAFWLKADLVHLDQRVSSRLIHKNGQALQRNPKRLSVHANALDRDLDGVFCRWQCVVDVFHNKTHGDALTIRGRQPNQRHQKQDQECPKGPLDPTPFPRHWGFWCG